MRELKPFGVSISAVRRAQYKRLGYLLNLAKLAADEAFFSKIAERYLFRSFSSHLNN